MDPAPRPATLSDPLAAAAARHPEKPAMVHGALALSYARVTGDVARIAAALAGLGIRPGDLVAVHVRKPVTHWMVTLGLMRLGAVSLSLTANAAGELDALPAVVAVICGPGETDTFPPRLKVFEVGRDWLERPLPATGELPARDVADRTAGRIAFTSGTSGRPKAVLLDAGRLAARLAGTAPRAGLTGDAVLWCGLGPDTAYGFTATIAAFREGATVVLSAGGAGAFGQMHARGVDLIIASPAALEPLVRDAEASGLPRLAGPAIVAGGRLSAALAERIGAGVATGVRVAYGSSEAGGVTLGDAAGLAAHPGAVGAVFAGVEAQVVDDRDRALPPGTEGLLKLRSDSMAAGYVDDPAASAQYFQDGWFLPGDIARLAADGSLTIVGRSAQILNLGGVKLPIEALEMRLAELDGVRDACALLFATETGDQRLVLVVAGPSDAGPALGAAIRAALPKLPEFALFTAPDIPRGSMGKVRKQAVAEAVGAVYAGADGGTLGVADHGTF